ncbi:DUF1576 domain-containing protein [Natranaerobius thermophilus]|uniref:DUF1576 domain-containing protein n=1 Tax=Natranaerobius thermophilus (strain ATCC BAA-1301 / DSM 18059 / JW/NM-WN-LF) TaxID=457570 RepID=B2A580_NATTJ|nr:DUF1576 domain-containing protein [Natranaerobius thermophilus]ACB83914.1 protein of unknown function DUF1576 [Natranaerobius thermophilus JW/NM-WN-LF]
MLLYLCALIIAGFIFGFEEGFIQDLREITTVPAVLVTDFFVVGSLGAALVNSGLVGIVGLFFAFFLKVPIKGPIIAAIFTMAGFSFLGKTIINIWPIFLGVWLYAKTQRETIHHYILNALFGTALAPIASSVSFGLGLGIWGGLILGALGGFLVPPLAGHFLATHQGMNLYNIGFTAGFVGTLFAGLFRGFGASKDLVEMWGTGFNPAIFIPLTIYLSSMIIVGLILNKGQLKPYFEIHKMSGALVSDFVTQKGIGSTLMNMGIVGLIGTLYVIIVGGELNGPSMAGIFTIVGFGAFGKHSLNMTPVMLGAFLSLQLFHWSPTEAGPILGVLFGTTLAPISGSFGPIAGIIAGFLHMSMVMNVGYLHGGLNLYNNGFAGGLVATMMVGVLKHFQTDSEKEGD